MAISLRRGALVGAGLAFVLLVAVSAVAWRSTKVLLDANASVNRTRDAIERLNRVRSLTSQVEATAEGGAASRAATVEAQSAALRTSVEAIRQFSAGNAEETALAVQLAAHVQQMVDPAAAVGDVHWAADLMRQRLNEMTRVENDLLLVRLETSQASTEQAIRALGLLVFWGGSLLAIALFVIYRQTQRQLELNRARHESEQYMRIVIDKMLGGLIISDTRGRIETINPAAEQMFGYAPGELVGESLRKLMAVSDEEAGGILEQMLGPILGKVTEWEIARRKDGSTFPMELSLSAFTTAGSQRLASHIRDISERREIDRMKDDFVAVVSHELRTPLTSIRGALQLVLADPPTFQDLEHSQLLEIALKNCERLIRLINDILDVAKIEAGQVKLRLRTCDVSEIVRTSLESVAEMARSTGVRFTVDDADRLLVRADADRLVQVLTNLLSNAVKFSPVNATIHVQSRAVGTSVEIAVRDQGPGMTREDISQLFGKFRQLDSSATRHQGGTGLGLSISKALIEQHGGTITVQSEPGHGSTFVVSLPAATEPRELAAAEVGKAAAQAPHVVILAEDDDDLRDVMSRALTRKGFRVMAAPNGDVARSLYDTMHPDALLVDLHMPVADGFGLIEHVRRTDRGREIPILVVSGSNTGTGETRSLALGANVFMTKPVDADALVVELNRLFNRQTS